MGILPIYWDHNIKVNIQDREKQNQLVKLMHLFL